MLSSAIAVTLSLTFGGGPIYDGGQQQAVPYGDAGSYAASALVEGAVPNAGFAPEATGGVYGERRLPYDSQEPWMHGYIQEIPPYGGFHFFRPYNYKHVMPQTQAAGGWGMAPTSAYSQQFWHRYQEQAAMQQEMSQVGYSEYAAELGRLRARHDFDTQRKAAAEQRANSVTSDARVASHTAKASSPTANNSRQTTRQQQLSRLKTLKQQIEQQQKQIQLLQKQLSPQRSRRPSWATPKTLQHTLRR